MWLRVWKKQGHFWEWCDGIENDPVVFSWKDLIGHSLIYKFFVDVDDSTPSGVYDFKFLFEFSDLENNFYTSEQIVPFYLKQFLS